MKRLKRAGGVQHFLLNSKIKKRSELSSAGQTKREIFRKLLRFFVLPHISILGFSFEVLAKSFFHDS